VILSYVQTSVASISQRQEQSVPQPINPFGDVDTSNINSNPHTYESLFQTNNNSMARSDSTSSHSTSRNSIRNHSVVSNSSSITNASIESILTNNNNDVETLHNPLKDVDLVDMKTLDWSNVGMGSDVKVEEFSL
jgi:hypothetical protein